MDDRYWIGSGNNWSSTTACSGTTCWATTSGGSPGASVPGDADIAIFDTNSGDATYDSSAVRYGGLDMQSAYSGTITLQKEMATYTGTVSGIINVKISGGTIDFNTYTLRNYAQAKGYVIESGGTIIGPGTLFWLKPSTLAGIGLLLNCTATTRRVRLI